MENVAYYHQQAAQLFLAQQLKDVQLLLMATLAMVVNGNVLPLQAKIKNKKEPSRKPNCMALYHLLSFRFKFIDGIYRKIC
jgi:hypothetical protein